VKRWLVDDGYDGSNIVVIPNGVDLSRFAMPGDRAELRSALGVPAGTKLVAVVSRLAALKGIEDFIDAAALVVRKRDDVRFLIVGEPSPINNRAYVDDLRARAAARGLAERVIFTGLRSDVPALLSAVDVSVMPSLNEALSNVLLESMAAGTAVVATDVGGTAEALVDRENGVLIPPGNPPVLADAIVQLVDDPGRARELGANARRTIADRYSLDRMVAATESLYDQLLSRKQRRAA
jgi:glycosyltransferase involved in cell wall biosynthesis